MGSRKRPRVTPPFLTCTLCGITKPCEDFRTDKSKVSGKMSACRGCDDIRKAAWREANKERRAAHARRYRAENPERWQETVSRYAENNVEKIRSRALVAAHKRRARQLAVASVPFTSAQLEQRIAYYGGRCWICGAAYKHIDHVKPLSRGGAHMLCNLRPTCQRCNNRKYNRWPFSPDMILGVA